MADPVRTAIRNRSLLAFFVLAFLLAWGFDAVPGVVGLTQPSWPSWFFAGFLSALSPSIAAAIVIYANGQSVREWLRSILRFRVHAKWYVAAIGVPFAITYAAGLAAAVLGGPVVWSEFTFQPATIVIGVVLGTLLGGGQEELGWRGFAQPELQARFGALPAAVLLGIVWGLWHLPQFVLGGVRSNWPLSMMAAYLVGIVAFSVLLAWVFNGSGGSAWLAMVMHGADNATTGQIPIDVDVVAPQGIIVPETLVTINVPHAIITWVVVAAVLLVAGTALHQSRVSPPLSRSVPEWRAK